MEQLLFLLFYLQFYWRPLKDCVNYIAIYDRNPNERKIIWHATIILNRSILIKSHVITNICVYIICMWREGRGRQEACDESKRNPMTWAIVSGIFRSRQYCNSWLSTFSNFVWNRNQFYWFSLHGRFGHIWKSCEHVFGVALKYIRYSIQRYTHKHAYSDWLLISDSWHSK